MSKITDLRIRDERRFPACWIPLRVFSQKLSSAALLTYMGLAYYGRSSSGCHVSLRELSTTIAISKSAVQRALKELEHKKLIRVEANFRKATKRRPDDHGQLANDYVLLELTEKPIPI